jgi:hypothetical protein
MPTREREADSTKQSGFAGLPDGIHIFKPKIALGYIFEGLATEDVGIFYGDWVYFMASRSIFVVIWYIFPVFVCCTKKNLAARVGSKMTTVRFLGDQIVRNFAIWEKCLERLLKYRLQFDTIFREICN